jgi:glycosyltransferase involved in cell wall biosynthesis
MLSVVTITFNNFEELVRTVDSVRGLPIEHIIVNGGKCQKTAEYLSSFKGISISEPDRGISDAFNKGIRLATGKAIMFLNSGDTLRDSKYLEWAGTALDEVDFTYSDMIFDDPIAGKLRITPTGKPLGRGMPYPHQTMIVRRSAFSELGEFKLEYKRAMCFEFTCRMEKAGKTSRYFPEATILMDGTGVSSTQEAHTLRESRLAMEETGLYTLENRYYFLIRKTFFYTRRAMVTLRLKPVLGLLKRIKRGSA